MVVVVEVERWPSAAESGNVAAEPGIAAADKAGTVEILGTDLLVQSMLAPGCIVVVGLIL